jgi:hypothetical protein
MAFATFFQDCVETSLRESIAVRLAEALQASSQLNPFDTGILNAPGNAKVRNYLPERLFADRPVPRLRGLT